jgi:glutamyl-tRNA synthetase
MPVRVRFAPSPTGYLHIGGARTALFNWAFARHEGGAFVLRIEDTDADRSTPQYERVILDELRWLGLDWDESVDVGGAFGPYRQTDRQPLYRRYVEGLLAAGRAYRCTCSAERLEELRAHQKEHGQRMGYDGHCRDAHHGPGCGPHVVRLRLEPGTTSLDDLIKGAVAWDHRELDDFILVRTDGMPMYNFCVVVDDVAMGITHVLRGDEHLNNTPKQLLIYDALGAARPAFGHMPLILALDGSKLSKRHGVTSVGQYRDMGIPPEALLNYLGRLGWSHGDLELFSLAELVELFTIEAIGKSPGKWDPDKLLWVSHHWMRTLPLERIVEGVRPFLASKGLVADERLTTAVALLRERARTFVELASALTFVFAPDDALRPDAEAEGLLAPHRPLMGRLATALAEVAWTEAALSAAVDRCCAAEGLKLGRVAQPARIALTGQKVGPGLYHTFLALGREATLRRLTA